MGDVDHRRCRAARCSLAISTRICDAQGGVEIGERLVEQEHARARARWRGRWRRAGAGRRKAPRGLRSSSVVELAGCRGLPPRPLLDRPAGSRPAELQAEGHVLARRHDADRAHRTGTPWRCRARRRRQVVDAPAADAGCRRRGLTSSSPAMMRSSVDLPQPEGADEDDEFAIVDRRDRCRSARRLAEGLADLVDA